MGYLTVKDLKQTRSLWKQLSEERELVITRDGTERMLVEFSQGNLLQKARSQPEKVKQVLENRVDIQ